VVETLADALFPALDPGLRRDDFELDAPSSPSEGPSASRHAGIRPTDALGARRYEEGAHEPPRAAVAEGQHSS